MSLWKRFLRAPAAAPAAGPRGAADRPPLEIARWLEPGENPYGVRCLDCGEFAERADEPAGKEAAARFAASRRETGEAYRGASPDQCATIACRLQYPAADEPAEDGPRFVATAPEERWDVFLVDGAWVFTRSSSGRLVYRVPRRIAGPFAFVESIEAEGEAARSDPGFCLREVDYLVKSHLHDFGVPHPLPRGLRGEEADLALFSFQRHGRRGLFATTADTLAIDPWALSRRGAPG